MNRDIFIDKYEGLNISKDEMEQAIQSIINFEKFIINDIEKATINDIERYMKHLIESGNNKYSEVIHFARYFCYVNMQDNYLHMTKYFNSLGVLENIVERIGVYESEDIKEIFLGDLELPPFGTSPKEMPRYTNQFIKRLLSQIEIEKCRHILAGNNHQIPDKKFSIEKAYYDNSISLKDYLKERHQRKVKELINFYENNRIWFEQIITPDVISFVKNNQEILSGVLKDNKLYITKIPYDINNYLKAKDAISKSYYACHCSFVRENILSNKEDIPKTWCYCSGGFAKRPFEVILGKSLNVKLLESAIDGDDFCRFEIDLTNIDYKK
ncbi:MAG: hypothetical protein PQJ44_01100 [Sphaerochaetaceae bacterium]|nr:hypothetical protein [Sphaerochaetaceae bacterium]